MRGKTEKNQDLYKKQEKTSDKNAKGNNNQKILVKTRGGGTMKGSEFTLR